MHTEIAQDYNNALESYVTCWLIKCADGSEFGFTDHDEDVWVKNVDDEQKLFRSAVSTSASNVERSLGLMADNMEIKGVINSDYLQEKDLLSDKFYNATVQAFMVDYYDINRPHISLVSGDVGEIKYDGERFFMEIVSTKQRLANATVGECFSPACRACLGDRRCKIDLTNFTIENLQVTVHAHDTLALQDDLTSIIAERWPSQEDKIVSLIKYGYITFTNDSGDLIRRELRGFASREKGSEIASQVLFLATSINSSIAGNTVSLTFGCDKSIDTCFHIFENNFNFRGEPHVPNEEIFKIK